MFCVAPSFSDVAREGAVKLECTHKDTWFTSLVTRPGDFSRYRSSESLSEWPWGFALGAGTAFVKER